MATFTPRSILPFDPNMGLLMYLLAEYIIWIYLLFMALTCDIQFKVPRLPSS